MKSIPVLGFAAYSGSGKTTLVEKIIPILKSRGFRIAVIKHDAHSFDVDYEGKDSWRFTQAGADISIVSSAEKTAVIEKRRLSFCQAAAFAHDVDIILVEGYKNEGFTQIGINRAATGKGFSGPIERFAALVTDEEVKAQGIPCFGFNDFEEIAEFIINNMDSFTCINISERDSEIR
ncbi:MAG: molybdopterin-guanine dinucleotide biosynthesis protein B [Oscillospiraceae bacterium]